MAEPATSKLNHVFDRHAGEIHYVDVDDAGVRDDIDDPGLYRDLLAREGARRETLSYMAGAFWLG